MGLRGATTARLVLRPAATGDTGQPWRWCRSHVDDLRRTGRATNFLLDVFRQRLRPLFEGQRIRWLV